MRNEDMCIHEQSKAGSEQRGFQVSTVEAPGNNRSRKITCVDFRGRRDSRGKSGLVIIAMDMDSISVGIRVVYRFMPSLLGIGRKATNAKETVFRFK